MRDGKMHSQGLANFNVPHRCATTQGKSSVQIVFTQKVVLGGGLRHNILSSADFVVDGLAVSLEIGVVRMKLSEDRASQLDTKPNPCLGGRSSGCNFLQSHAEIG